MTGKETQKTDKSAPGRTKLPRGIRNNNPGNLRRTETKWEGMSALQEDADFVCFTAPVWGLRALMKTLLSYQRKHGLKTIDAMITRYAPPVENKTAHYVWHVARCMGISHKQRIDLSRPDVLARMARAIVGHENGAPPDDWRGGQGDWYTPETYARAAGLALGFMPDAAL